MLLDTGNAPLVIQLLAVIRTVTMCTHNNFGIHRCIGMRWVCVVVVCRVVDGCGGRVHWERGECGNEFLLDLYYTTC